MGGRPNAALLEKTERKLKSPSGAPRTTEQPRRRGSSARYIRDPMTRGYRPGGACRSCGTIPRKSSRSPGPFLVVSHYTIWTTVITLQTPPVIHRPRGSSVQVDCPIAACAFALHMVNAADFSPGQVDISLVAIYFRELSLVGSLLSLISPPRPRCCSADLPNPCRSTLRRGQPSTCYKAEESQLNVCSHLSVAFAVGFPGLHKTPVEPKSRPPNLGP